MSHYLTLHLDTN